MLDREPHGLQQRSGVCGFRVVDGDLLCMQLTMSFEFGGECHCVGPRLVEMRVTCR